MRWLTEFGDSPSAPWVALLNAYRPDDIKHALELMVEQKLAHPPTLPMFEALLKRAAHKMAPQTVDYTRGFWRAIIVDHCSRMLVLRQTITNTEKFEQYLIENKTTLGQPMRALLDELCDLELRNQGQRTPGLFTLAHERCRNICIDETQQRRMEVA